MSTAAVSGVGLGLRPPYYERFCEDPPPVDFVEVISENFLVGGGNPRHVLRRVRERFPVLLHGVSMSLGSADPLDDDYLRALRALAEEVQPAAISDHLCWSSFGGVRAHDLLPLPFTEEALAHLTSRISAAQERLGARLLIENVSSYLTFCASTIPEWEFLTELTRRTGCGLLLDVNNVFVSAHNHGFDAERFLAEIPVAAVGEMHLAGHTQRGELLLDTHDQPVKEGVWALYRAAVRRFGSVATLLERDDNFPALEELLAECGRVRATLDEEAKERVVQ